jgi:hypothetical protein
MQSSTWQKHGKGTANGWEGTREGHGDPALLSSLCAATSPARANERTAYGSANAWVDAEETEEPCWGTAVTVRLLSLRAAGRNQRRTAYAQGRATNRGSDTRRPATEETSGMQAVGCKKGVRLSSWRGGIALAMRSRRRAPMGFPSVSSVCAIRGRNKPLPSD